MENQQEQPQVLTSIQYKLLEPNNDYKEAKIEKSGITAQFTIKQIEDSIEYYGKKEKEMSAQVALEKAKMFNIEEFHPFVKDMSDKDMLTVSMYYEAKVIVQKSEPKIKEIQDAIKDSSDEVKLITEKLGFAVPTEITPEEVK